MVIKGAKEEKPERRQMGLGAKIKQLREEKGWSQGQLATYAGLKRSYVSMMEKDAIKSPGAQPMIKLAKGLEVSEDVLFEAAGMKKVEKLSYELEEFMIYLQGKNPSPETVRQLRKIAEALLPESEQLGKSAGE